MSMRALIFSTVFIVLALSNSQASAQQCYADTWGPLVQFINLNPNVTKSCPKVKSCLVEGARIVLECSYDPSNKIVQKFVFNNESGSIILFAPDNECYSVQTGRRYYSGPSCR